MKFYMATDGGDAEPACVVRSGIEWFDHAVILPRSAAAGGLTEHPPPVMMITGISRLCGSAVAPAGHA